MLLLPTEAPASHPPSTPLDPSGILCLSLKFHPYGETGGRNLIYLTSWSKSFSLCLSFLIAKQRGWIVCVRSCMRVGVRVRALSPRLLYGILPECGGAASQLELREIPSIPAKKRPTSRLPVEREICQGFFLFPFGPPIELSPFPLCEP